MPSRPERLACAMCGHAVRHVDGQPSARHLASRRHVLAEAPPPSGVREASWPPPAAHDAFAPAPANDAPILPAAALEEMRVGVAGLGSEEEGRAA